MLDEHNNAQPSDTEADTSPTSQVPPTATRGASSGDSTPPRSPWVWAAAVGVFVLVFLAAYGLMNLSNPSKEPVVTRAQQPPRDHSQAVRPPLAPDVLFARSSPAVVRVATRDRRGRAWSGSGFLVSTAGLIATNYHVIEKAATAEVVLADKTKLAVAGIAAFDPEADLAIIKVVEQPAAQPLELAEEDIPPVGSKVYAIGTPLGTFSNTLSDGLVSGHRERGSVPDFPKLPTMIQTTAPISHGSSGGPLLRADGKVIGVITLTFASEGENLNFAVPVYHVGRLVLQSTEGRLTQLPLVQRSDAVECVRRGNAWLENKEIDEALEEFEEAIRLNPNYAVAYNGRGRVWGIKKEYDKAIRDFDEAIRLDPKYAGAYSNRGFAWSLKKDFALAMRDLDEAIRLDAKLVLAYGHRGDVWMHGKEYDKAISDYDEAIRLDPKSARYFNGRGFAWFLKKSYNTAIRDFSEAIRLNPDYAPAYFNRGNAWLRNRESDNAIRDYNRFIALTPGHALAYYNRGCAWANIKNYDQAIRDFDECIRLDPNYTPAYTTRSSVMRLKRGR